MNAPKVTTILMIDDDTKLASILAKFVEKYHFKLVHASRADEGLREFARVSPEAILLDVDLAGESGLDLCRKIREKSPVPIVMISALTETSDRVLGLQIGADSYLPKPFEPRELVAHLEAVLRRVNKLSAPVAPEKATLGEMVIDRSRRQVSIRGSAIEISSAEFELLCVLSSKPGHVWNRDELLNELKGIDWDAYNRSVDLLVSRLRKKLGDNPKKPQFLKTVWGTGYVFLPQDTERKVG